MENTKIAQACQEDAIAFGEWLRINKYVSVESGYVNIGGSLNLKIYTTAQLYAIYLTDKNKEGL